MNLIVGSTALAFYGLERKSPKDTDVWVTSLPECKRKNHDYHVMPLSIIKAVPSYLGCATEDACYTIKCSHLAWDIHWQKTKLDILWLKAKGCKLLPELYELLKKHWVKEKGDKDFLSLDKTKEEFFDDYVPHRYDHDYLHTLVSFPNEPAYIGCLKGEVLIDKKLFDKLSFSNQIKMFREEITVIACERYLIPSNKYSWFDAYKLALKKTIISLTKNWANTFIITNLEHFCLPDYSYFNHILQELKMTTTTIDLTPFEEILEEGDLAALLYQMGEGDSGWYPEGYYVTSKPDETWEQRRVRQEALLLEKLGYQHISQEGGGEGGAEDCEGIFKFKGKTYRVEYNYYSHNGHEYDTIVSTLEEVFPVEVTRTEYTSKSQS